MRKGFSSKTQSLKKLISASLAIIMTLSMSLVPVSQRVFADEENPGLTSSDAPDVDPGIDGIDTETSDTGIDNINVDTDDTDINGIDTDAIDIDSITAKVLNNAAGIHIYATKDGDSWSGANIIMGDNAGQWPFSTGGPVAFTPEKDTTYTLTYNVTSTGALGFRVRWITGNDSDSYTAGDIAVVNDHRYAASATATSIPAYFENTISSGNTLTYAADFPMSGSEVAGGLIGNLAIRGQTGNNDFYFNWIKIVDKDDNVLAYWEPGVKPAPDGSASGLNWDEYPALQEVYKDYFLFGVMDSPDNAMPQAKQDLIAYHFNSVTPGNAMKPISVQAVQDIFTFDLIDEIWSNLAPGTYKVGHTLGWHSQSPAWIWGGDSYNITKADALLNIQTHVDTVLNRFGGDMYAMDVVNEAMGDKSSDNWRDMLRMEGWKSTPLGSDWVEEFFKAAAVVVDAEGWDCKLYYNDFGLDNPKKAQAVYNMVKEINENNAGTRPDGKQLIEGIGMQAHYNGQTVPANVEKSIILFNTLPGVSVSITEMDIAYATTDGILTPTQAKLQAYKYAQLFQIYKKYAAGDANPVVGNRLIERVSVAGAQDRTDGGWLSGSAPTLFSLGATIKGKESLVAVLDPDKYVNAIVAGPQIEFPKANAMFGSPKIGEDDNEWDNADTFNAATQPLKNPLGNGYEATAKMKAMWDNDFLYVRAIVTDSYLTQNSSATYETDSVEVFVSETAYKGTYVGGDGNNQYRVTYKGDKSIKTGDPATAFESYAEEVDGGYLVEFKIPFTKIKPKNGTGIGFDVQINDVNGTSRKLTVWSDVAADGYNTTTNWGTLKLVKPVKGVYVYAMKDEATWSGANIVLGNDTTQWPFSNGGTDGDVAFVPEKDATYRLKFNVTSTGAAGYRVRWVKGNENGGYTADDATNANANPYNAGAIATKVPAHFNAPTIVAGDTRTYTVDFIMDGNAVAEGLIGNIAIRGTSGSSALYINWLTVETMDGELLVEWGDSNVPEPEPEPEPIGKTIIKVDFNDADKALYANNFAQNGGQAAFEWVHQTNIGHGDDYALKGIHVNGDTYIGANHAARFTLPEPLKMGGIYRISYWVYVPSAGNEGKGALTGPGFVLNGDYAGATGISKFPNPAPGTIGLNQWIQVNVTIPRIEAAPVATIDFRFVVDGATKHPDVWYVDDIEIALVDMADEVRELVWDLTIPSLKETYKDLFLFGNVVEPRDTTNPEFNAMFNRHYNAVTPTNEMKPIRLSTAKGVYDYSRADQIVDWALSNNISVHGHTLVWHSQSAAWLSPTGATREEARANLQEYINNVAGHFAGKVMSWDVANEVFVDGGGSGSWQNQIRQDPEGGRWYLAYANGADASKGESGADYIYDAFVFARLADPNAVLYYNDFNDDIAAKSIAIAAMVVELNAKWETDPRNTEPGRLLIEGIGMQSHYNVNTLASNVEASIQRFIATGARISISELDSTDYNNKSSLSPAEQERQAKFYAQLFTIYTKYAEHIDRVTVWGTEDRSSWRSTGHPTLFDEFYEAKESFKAAIDPYNYLGTTAPAKPSPSNSIAYTAVADGSANVATSSKITLTFSEAITGLTVASVNFDGGSTSVTLDTLNRISGTVYELTLKGTVTTSGDVKITMNKLGIEAATKNVPIHIANNGYIGNNGDNDNSGNANGANTGTPPTVTQPEKVIASQDSSKTIQDAIKNGNTPIIVIDNNSKGVAFNGKDLVANAENGSNLEIKNGQAQISITPDVVNDLGIKDASKVEIVLTPNVMLVDKKLDENLATIDKINKALENKIIDLGIKVDGKDVISTKAPVKVTIDVSRLNLTDAQKKNFTGVCFDKNLATYKQLGGEFSADGKSFIFHTYNEGKVGVIVSDKVYKIKLTIDSTAVNVNGSAITNDVAPIIVEGRTLMPLRVVAENLGADVNWNSDTASVTVTKDGKSISIKISDALPGGMGTAQIINDRTYVPVRYILEQLGANVVWDEATRSVSIYQ